MLTGGYGGTLSGVTLDGNFDISGTWVYATDGLTLNGSVTLGGSNNWGGINFIGSQTLGGSGTVTFAGAGAGYIDGLGIASSTDLTIGAAITIAGQFGFIGRAQLLLARRAGAARRSLRIPVHTVTCLA